jgi:Heavy-metal resistance
MSVRRRVIVMLGLLIHFLTPVWLLGGTPGPPGPLGPPGPPGLGGDVHLTYPGFLRTLFPPELIMQHQRAIGLRPEQHQAIHAAMRSTQEHILDLQWRLLAATEDLTKLLAAEQIDEAAATAKADEVIHLEQQFKRAHLVLLIRIKNLLDPQQQAQLAQLRPPIPRSPPPGEPWPKGQ